MTHSSRNPLLSVKWLTSPKKKKKRRHKNMDDRKSVQTEWRQNSSSLSIFIFLETFYRFPPWFNYSWLSQHPLLLLCQEPWIHSWLQTVHEEVRHKLLISNLCAVVQSAGFSLKTQPRLVTSDILAWFDYCNCLLMGTPNSVIEPLQKIKQIAARLVLLAPRHHHSTPLLEKYTLASHFRTC